MQVLSRGKEYHMNILQHRHPSLLIDRALLRHVDTVQELTDILVPYAADTLDRRSCRRIRQIFRVQEKQYILPDCDTFWMSVPSRISSSFWFFDSEMVTPSSIFTCRTIWNNVSGRPNRDVNRVPSRPKSYGSPVLDRSPG